MVGVGVGEMIMACGEGAREMWHNLCKWEGKGEHGRGREKEEYRRGRGRKKGRKR
jgi:hypothetical protein